jgi:phosphatidylglycerophosphate synthase
MLDGVVRRLIDPPLEWAGRHLASLKISANTVTTAGLIFGLLAALAIALGHTWWGFAGICLSRLADGLDGAVARATTRTDLGGYLDIVYDFFFYGAIPLAFVIADPSANGVAGAVLLASFYANGATFLAFSILAEKHHLKTRIRGAKSLYFTTGLAEGTETIAVFLVWCAVPAWFSPVAWIFAAICLVTAIARVILAYRTFGRKPVEM